MRIRFSRLYKPDLLVCTEAKCASRVAGLGRVLCDPSGWLVGTNHYCLVAVPCSVEKSDPAEELVKRTVSPQLVRLSRTLSEGDKASFEVGPRGVIPTPIGTHGLMLGELCTNNESSFDWRKLIPDLASASQVPVYAFDVKLLSLMRSAMNAKVLHIAPKGGSEAALAIPDGLTEKGFPFGIIMPRVWLAHKDAISYSASLRGAP